MSAAKRRELRERKKLEAVVKAPGCAARDLVLDVACWGPIDWDEAKMSSLGGSRTDPANAQPLCRGHHEWSHRNPVKAERLGIKVGSGGSSDWLGAKSFLADELRRRVAG